MGPLRFAFLALIFAAVGVPLHAQSKNLTVTGKLTRVMAIGAESSDWSIELTTPITLDGMEVHSLEVHYSDSQKLESLKDHWVKAKGKLSTASGVETGPRTSARFDQGDQRTRAQNSIHELALFPSAPWAATHARRRFSLWEGSDSPLFAT